MSNYLIFHEGVLFKEADSWRSPDVPEGCFVYSTRAKQWYHVKWSSSVPLNTCDVPKGLLTWVLILS